MRNISAGMVLAAVITVAACVAAACGPDFPWQPFDNRKQTLALAPANSFAWEVQRLVQPSPGGARAVEAPAFYGSDPAFDATIESDVAKVLKTAGDPADLAQIYASGAAAFYKAAWQAAASQFADAVALPSAKTAPRALWAEYSLGRALAKLGDRAGAEAAFVKTRAMAARGMADPLGLAVASLGEQARLRLDAGDAQGAVALYAEQAADGSAEAVQSLRMVATQCMASPDRLKSVLADPITQRLLVVYALAQTGDFLVSRTGDLTDNEIQSENSADTIQPLHEFVQALQESGAPIAEADRLASLAYRVGDYGAARSLAEKSATPMALWVRAKLALHDGNNAEAANFFAGAVAAAKANGGATLEASSQALLQGETGTLTLARGDFRQAMAVLWPVAGTYWGDVAYLAERVLTTDELKTFVDSNVPAPASLPTPYGLYPVNKVAQLRDLLARRLMRDGRYDEAVAYFTSAGPNTADMRVSAKALGNAMHRASAAFWATDRAKAAWQAASLLRRDGLELVGTEIQPDEAATGGMLAYGYGPLPDTLFKQAGLFTQAERERYAASAPKPDARFHYRYGAADQALAAAANVPARSQAYAAMLCKASGWLLQTHEPEKARAIYALYVAKGAALPFAKHFGEACPDPDFSKIPGARRKLLVAQARDTFHRHKWPLLGGAALGALCVGGFALRKRRT